MLTIFFLGEHRIEFHFTQDRITQKADREIKKYHRLCAYKEGIKDGLDLKVKLIEDGAG